MLIFTKSAEKPRHSCRGWIGVGRAGLNAQEPNKTPAVPKPSMGEGTAEVEAPAFMPGRTSTDQVERLAHHAMRSELWDKALAYGRQAGGRAATRSAYREAVAY